LDGGLLVVALAELFPEPVAERDVRGLGAVSQPFDLGDDSLALPRIL
jgi:hypothetical protein